jgi:hypothetical protein
MYYLRSSYFFLLSVFFFLSCKKKEDGSVKGNYSDILGGYSVQYTDTFKIFGYTKKIDSVFSSNSSEKFLGSHQDPVFGRTDASILTNFSLPNNITNVTFGTNPYLVQAELNLILSSLDITGNLNTPLNFEVYLLQKPLQVNGFYSTNDYQLQSNVLVGNYTGTLVPVGDKLGLKIPLDYNFAQALITNTQALVNTTQLQTIYKGFFITCRNSNLNPSSLPGFIGKFDLDHASSGLVVYYKPNGNDPTKTANTFTFTFKGINAKRYNMVQYQPFLSSDINLQKQLNGDTSMGNINWFVKGMNGTRVRIYIPGIKNLKNLGNVLISRAELQVYADPSKNPGTTLPPDYLALFSSDSLGREMYTADQMSSLDFARYNGAYDAVNKRYVFNIPREIQQIVNGTKKNYGFWLVVANPDKTYASVRDNNLRHIVLGGNQSSLRPKMIITLGIPKQ